MSDSEIGNSEIDRSLFVNFFLANSGERNIPFTKILLDEDNHTRAMSQFYREKLNQAFLGLANLNPPVMLNDVEPVCKLKLLTHFWLVKEMKADRISNQGIRTNSDELLENWHLCNVDDMGMFYRHGNVDYYVSFAQVKNPFKDTVKWSVQVQEDRTGVIECAGFTVLPGDCSNVRAEQDEEIIARITANLVKWIRAFVTKVESRHFTPKSPYGSLSGSNDS